VPDDDPPEVPDDDPPEVPDDDPPEVPDDDPPEVSVGDAEAVIEGDDPAATVDMVFTVALSVASDRPVTVSYELGGTASGGTDYTAPDPLSATIAVGDTTATITVKVKGDEIAEGDETVVVTLTKATNAAISAVQGASTGTGMIVDDDAVPPGVVLSADPSSVAENAGATTVTVTAVLGGTTLLPDDVVVAVKIGAAGDSAESGADYAAVESFDVTIPAGARSAVSTFTLTPLDDALDEPDESLTVHGTATALAVTATAVQITDDDEDDGGDDDIVTAVEDVEAPMPPEPEDVPVEELPFTGQESLLLFYLATTLVLAGLFLVGASRLLIAVGRYQRAAGQDRWRHGGVGAYRRRAK